MRNARHQKKGLWLAAALLLVTLALAAGASAQLGDPGESTGVDTPVAPVAKEPAEKLFTQVAGARWDSGGPVLPPDSPTPVEVDFFAVSALDEKSALAGGAGAVGGERRPVVYRFGKEEGWVREELPAVAGGPGPGVGFVAEVGWIDATHALAVGGDGIYPERERDDGSSVCADAGAPPPANEAGVARVWLYAEGAGWRELAQRPDGEPGDELPDDMTALTALDFFVPDPKAPVEFGVAGGLCQLWHWRDGGFEKTQGGGWEPADRGARYRVRDVTFAEPGGGLLAVDRRPRAVAVTAGCCVDAGDATKAADALNGAPETLTYQPPVAAGAHPADGTWTKTVAAAAPRLTTPDSYMAVAAYTQTTPTAFLGPGTVRSPAGPQDPNGLEPASHVNDKSVGISTVRLTDADGDTGGSATRYLECLSGASNRTCSRWLVVPLPDTRPANAWENDIATVWLEDPGAPSWTGNAGIGVTIGGAHPTGPDGVPDWSVGGMGASGRAVAYGTDPAQLPPPKPGADKIALDGCAAEGTGPQALPQPGCLIESANDPTARTLEGEPPTDEGRLQAALRSSRLVELSSYTLHALDMVDQVGVGWAVGERGAIVRVSPDESARSRPVEKPPAESQRRRAPLPDRSGWTGLRPAPAAPGVVPALGGRPRVQEREPRLHLEPGFAPSEFFTPDGRQGWTFRSKPVQVGLASYSTQVAEGFYDGGRWYRCDVPSGASHPACSSFADLEQRLRPLHLQMLAPVRVPHENDDDPSDDGQVELVAKLIRTAYTPPDSPELRLARSATGAGRSSRRSSSARSPP